MVGKHSAAQYASVNGVGHGRALVATAVVLSSSCMLLAVGCGQWQPTAVQLLCAAAASFEARRVCALLRGTLHLLHACGPLPCLLAHYVSVVWATLWSLSFWSKCKCAAMHHRPTRASGDTPSLPVLSVKGFKCFNCDSPAYFACVRLLLLTHLLLLTQPCFSLLQGMLTVQTNNRHSCSTDAFMPVAGSL